MRASVGLLLRLVCSIALLFSALPIQAGVVCVERGRVVGLCPMASIPGAVLREPARAAPTARARMACCRPQAAPLRRFVPPADTCPNHPKTRCAYAYRTAFAAALPNKAPPLDVPPVPAIAVLPGSPAASSAEILVGAGGVTFAGDSDPPRFRPPAPDRGRAPPVV